MEKNYKEFDFIWASPPCTTHTRMRNNSWLKKVLPDLRLYSIIIFLDRFFDGFWVVENVISHYKPIIRPTIILDRHYFWSNFPLKEKKYNKPKGNFKNLPKEVLCEYLQIEPSIIDLFKDKNWKTHDGKRQILRNCVSPELGKDIFGSIKTITLMDFINEEKIVKC